VPRSPLGRSTRIGAARLMHGVFHRITFDYRLARVACFPGSWVCFHAPEKLHEPCTVPWAKCFYHLSALPCLHTLQRVTGANRAPVGRGPNTHDVDWQPAIVWLSAHLLCQESVLLARDLWPLLWLSPRCVLHAGSSGFPRATFPSLCDLHKTCPGTFKSVHPGSGARLRYLGRSGVRAAAGGAGQKCCCERSCESDKDVLF